MLTISIQIALVFAYFSFFLLIFRATHNGRRFDDLILHQEVPELVYLQTRKLLRDIHYKRAEVRRSGSASIDDKKPEVQEEE